MTAGHKTLVILFIVINVWKKTLRQHSPASSMQIRKSQHLPAPATHICVHQHSPASSMQIRKSQHLPASSMQIYVDRRTSAFSNTHISTLLYPIYLPIYHTYLPIYLSTLPIYLSVLYRSCRSTWKQLVVFQLFLKYLNSLVKLSIFTQVIFKRIDIHNDIRINAVTFNNPVALSRI